MQESINYQDHFYKYMLTLTIPVALQSLITSALNMIDTVMISSLGDAAIAGVGLANQVFFFYILICFGINTGSSVLIAQYHGAKDVARLRLVNGLTMTLCFSVGMLFSIVAIAQPHFVMGLMTKDPLIIQEGAAYLRMVAFSYVPTALAAAIGSALLSTGTPNPPLFASVVGFITNTVLNYVLIFGHFGFPAMGVVGAALATTIARVAEFSIVFIFKRTYGGLLTAPWRKFFGFDSAFIRHYFDITLPVILNESFWSLGQVLYNVAYALAGREAIAAVQVVASVNSILFVIVRGLGPACAIMIGNTIGQGKLDQVYHLALRFIKVTLALGFVMSVGLFLGRDLVLKIFADLSPAVYQNAMGLLAVRALIFTLASFNSVMVVGVLRGGGDTRFSMYMETAAVWLVGVPLAFFGALVLKLPIAPLMLLVLMEDGVKAVVGLKRLLSKKWIHPLKELGNVSSTT